MADNEKPLADGDKAAERERDREKPMPDPKARVRAKPVRRKNKRKYTKEERTRIARQNADNEQTADRVDENLPGEIEKAAREAGEKPGATRQDQYEAADKAAEEAARSVPRHKVREIQYEVGDEDGSHEGAVEPKEGAPPPDEDDD